jgi:cytochrome P450
MLIKHPKEMEKLQNEIDANCAESFTYENISNLEYLDLFLKEVLRMYPIANKYFFLFLNKIKNFH